MKLILGGINGQYLREIVDNAAEETERVDAIVAYATDMSLLFEWCWDKSIPLRFWGRFDEEIPVALAVLRKFIARNSPMFECRLVRHLHAKVIWWRGYGIYVGSANLTARAWYNNIEAGWFFMESEIEAGKHATDIEMLFRETHRHSTPLTRELVQLLEHRGRSIALRQRADSHDATALLENPSVPLWEGLVAQSAMTAEAVARQNFVIEWNETLEKMRSLSELVSSDSNRPSWIPPNVSRGAQADQFLHAYYYQKAFEGRRAVYERLFERNRGNPRAAVTEAVGWWRALTSAPGGEDATLRESLTLHKLLSEKSIGELTQPALHEICTRVYAIRDHARRVPNRDVGLASGATYTIDEKVLALSMFLFTARSEAGTSIADTIRYVLYDGLKREVPLRIWEAVSNPRYRIDHFGISAIGELVGWALPDDFPPRNRRTSKALRALGHDVVVHT